MFVVAGVTGHVGKVVASELLARKQQVKVIVRDAAKGREWSARGAEVAVGSLDDAAFLAGALKRAAGLFTLLPPNYAAQDFYAAQRKSADAITSAVKTSGVPLVVLLSSVGADLATDNGPIKGLHYLETALRETSTKLVAIRSGYFIENIENSLTPAKTMGIFPNFTPSRDYAMPMVATRDIGKLAAQTLVSPPARPEVIDLTGPAYSINQLADKLGKKVGKTLNIVDIPPQGHVDALTQAGLPRSVAEAFAEMYAGFAAGKLVPHGDRIVTGTTTLDEVLAAT